MKNRAQIKGVDYPETVHGAIKFRPKTPIVRPRQFVWLAALIGIVMGVAVFGTPHIRYIYRYTGSYENPYYLTCDYAGWHSQRFVPDDGRCPLFKFLKAQREGR